MNVHDVYRSRFLVAADLKGRTFQLTIVSASLETVNDRGQAKQRIALKLARGDGSMVDRMLLLNVTNMQEIAGTFGPVTDQWQGKVIELFPTTRQFSGQAVAALGVRVPPESIQAPQASAMPASATEGI